MSSPDQSQCADDSNDGNDGAGESRGDVMEDACITSDGPTLLDEIEDVEAHDLPTHVGGIHPVREAITVDVGPNLVLVIPHVAHKVGGDLPEGAVEILDSMTGPDDERHEFVGIEPHSAIYRFR